MFTAEAFAKNFLGPQGWKRTDLKTIKAWMHSDRAFDVIIQRKAPAGKRYGHIAIPIGLNARDDLMVAEASLGQVTNRIRVFSAQEASKFTIFVHY